MGSLTRRAWNRPRPSGRPTPARGALESGQPSPSPPGPVSWRASEECLLQCLRSLSAPALPTGQWIPRPGAALGSGPPLPGQPRRSLSVLSGGGAPRSAGKEELSKVLAAGVGEGSEGKVRAGAGALGRERKNILCPPPDARGGGGSPGREGRLGGAPGRGKAPPPRSPVLFLRGRHPLCSQGFRRGFLGPHAFAAVTGYREAPESGSWAGVSASWGGDGLREWDP